MNERALSALEYDKILSRLEAHAATAGGKSLCAGLRPMTALPAIRAAQAETAAACDRVRLKGSLSLGGVTDVRPSLMRLSVGAALSAGELLKIGRLLEVTASAASYGKAQEEAPQDALSALFGVLTPLPALQRDIERCIISEEEIADDASSELSRLRRQLAAAQARVHAELQSVLQKSAEYLQDSVITMRSGRYVIPVKAANKNMVPGMVHDQSASGSTYFIEPMGVLRLNNEIRELELAEQKEILRILAELSERAGQEEDAIRANYDALTALDFIFARAALAREMKAEEPVFFEDRHLTLKGARHPLLDPKTVVPIDLSLGKDFDLLVITGPNTGGKTVALKTVGLLTLMGQSGLHIPAYAGSELSVFSDVFADIGDEQSIEQSLSTFSSHMTRIVEILRDAQTDSLILFDELGAGTDPVEGAALAQAILSSLHRMGIRTMATTHYSELKLFALQTEGVMNASCEFDVDTLRPTYRLILGIPGKSNAFAISRKLGLPEHLIDDARALLKDRDEAFEDVIAQLDASRRSLETDKAEAARLRAETDALHARLSKEKESLEREKRHILEEARAQAASLLQEAKEETDAMIARITKLSTDKGLNKALEEERQALRKKLDALQPQREERKTPAPKGPEAFKIGDGVRVLSMGLDGIVTGRASAKGMIPVKMGILNSQVHYTDLAPREEETVTGDGVRALSGKRERSGASQIKVQKSMSVSPEINLIGMTVDEAVPALDKYLDDAYLAHLTQVRVVHGRGTGALRQAVQKHLKALRYVKDYHEGAYTEGGNGVTIVVFDTKEDKA